MFLSIDTPVYWVAYRAGPDTMHPREDGPSPSVTRGSCSTSFILSWGNSLALLGPCMSSCGPRMMARCPPGKGDVAGGGKIDGGPA